MSVALLGVAGRSAAVGVLRQPASEVAAGAFVLALDMSLVPVALSTEMGAVCRCLRGSPRVRSRNDQC